MAVLPDPELESQWRAKSRTFKGEASYKGCKGVIRSHYCKGLMATHNAPTRERWLRPLDFTGIAVPRKQTGKQTRGVQPTLQKL